MTDDSYLLDSNDKKEKKSGKWFSRLLKLIFFICALILVILTVLHNMGGSNEMLKDGVKQTISNIFGGRPVKMKSLVNMSFFPTVALDIEEVSVYEKEDDFIPLIRLKAFQAYMPFWNVATRNPRMTKFYIEDFEAIKGVFLPEELKIKKVFIDHDVENATAVLRGNGKVGIHEWNFDIDLDVNGTDGKYSFMVSGVSNVTFNIADVHVKGTFIRGEGNFFKLQDFDFVHGNKRIGGDITISALSEKLIKLKGTIKTKDDRSILLPDLILDLSQYGQMEFSGSVNSDKVIIDDWVGDNSIFEIFTRLREIIGQTVIPRRKDGVLALFGGSNLDVDFNLKNVDVAGHNRAELNFKLIQDSGRIKIGPFMDTTDMVMPVVMALYDQDKERLVSIIQDGKIDVSLVKPWLDNLPSEISVQETIDVECGIIELSEKYDHIDILSFGIHTKTQVIGVRETKIPIDTMFSDLHFETKSSREDLSKIELPKSLFEFVQGSLQKSKQGSRCSSYISPTALTEQFSKTESPQKSDQQGIQ